MVSDRASGVEAGKGEHADGRVGCGRQLLSEAIGGEGEERSRWARLVVAEEAFIVAVVRFKFRWDGWEKVAAKGDIGMDDGRVVGRERSGGE